MVSRFEVYRVHLDPTVGGEIRKTRPCVIVSPDEMNRHIATVTVVPLTTGGQAYPSRVACNHQGRQGQVVLEQIRTIDKTRFGSLPQDAAAAVLQGLADLFAP